LFGSIGETENNSNLKGNIGDIAIFVDYHIVSGSFKIRVGLQFAEICVDLNATLANKDFCYQTGVSTNMDLAMKRL
tara:strand:- start:371 stop:598 length:228 start_codon:yes stop_codon:yes gene_type:complete